VVLIRFKYVQLTWAPYRLSWIWPVVNFDHSAASEDRRWASVLSSNTIRQLRSWVRYWWFHQFSLLCFQGSNIELPRPTSELGEATYIKFGDEIGPLSAILTHLLHFRWNTLLRFETGLWLKTDDKLRIVTHVKLEQRYAKCLSWGFQLSPWTQVLIYC